MAGGVVSRLHAEPAATKPAVADLSDVVRKVRGSDRVPGLWGAVTRTDGLMAIGADGWRKFRSDVPVTSDDCVHLGSCTKAMTATLIGRAVQAGRLLLDRTLADCFPDFAAKADRATVAVTVRQLLDHRGGLLPNVDWRKFDAMPGTLTERRRAVVEYALGKPPRNPPGSKFEYSNVGYMTLGAILEAIHERPWEAVIADDLFKPLGMTGMGFGPPGTAGQIDQPWGHAEQLGLWVADQFDNPAVLGPAGRVHGPMAEWAKYVAWTLRADAGDTPLLSHATQAKLLSDTAGYSAAGWETTDRLWAGGRTLVHSGDNTRWHCVTWLAPKRGFAVLAATNLGGANAAKVCDDLSAALIGWHDQQAG